MPRKHQHRFRIPETNGIDPETDFIPVKCSGCSVIKEHRIFWHGYNRYELTIITPAEKQRRKDELAEARKVSVKKLKGT